VFQLKNIEKTLASVPENIHFCIILMKIISSVAKESIRSRPFTTNYTKKRKLGLLVQHVKGFLDRMVKRKKT